MIQEILYTLFIAINLASFGWMAYDDLRNMYISNLWSLIHAMILVWFNFFLLFYFEIWVKSEAATQIIWSNLIAGCLGGLFIYMIIKLTKGKGMGEGDIRIAIIMGLLLGVSKFIVAMYCTVILGSIIGLIVAIQKKKFKNLKIPLVPFMFMGTLIAFFYGDYLAQIFLPVF